MSYAHVLEVELEALKQMCQLLEEEHELLLQNDSASFIAFVERKQVLNRHLQQCEEHRMLVMGTMTWKELIEKDPTLRPQVDEMKQVLERLTILAKESEAWNAIAKHHKEQEIEWFSKWLGTQEVSYRKQGTYETRPSGTLIKRKV